MSICQCGCGGTTNTAPQDIARRGLKKGEHFRFIQGHGRWNSRSEPRPTGYWTARQSNGKTKAQHLVIAARVFGGPLPVGAEVHHVDGNARNNTHSNLVICQDSAYHKLLHVRTRALRAGCNPNTHKMCPTCNRALPFGDFYPTPYIKATERTRECKRCILAAQKNRYQQRRTRS